MKRLFFLILLLPFYALAQDCNLPIEKDQYSNELKVSSGFITLDRASLSIDADSKMIDFFFTLNGNGKCFDYESSVVLSFEGSKLKTNYKSSGTINCEGYFHFSFRNGTGTPSTLLNIATRKVLTMKFMGTNKTETNLALTDEQQQTLMELAACVIKEAKTLLK
ncbi:MAG: hypothetical protein ACHQEB_04250 [Chitinophagales bacterium]